MSLEKFLVVRPDGQTEKSKSFDKIDTKALSFFAPIASSPASQSFQILGGSVYIDKNFVYFGDTTVSMGIGGNFQSTALAPNFYNVALFSLDSLGNLAMTEGVPAASAGAVQVPTFPSGHFPIAKVLFQDNGSGAAGTIRPLQESDVVDVRPFFYGNYGKPTFGTDALADFKAGARSPSSTQVLINSGSIWFNDGSKVDLVQTTVNFGVGGDVESPSLTPSWYNKALLVIDLHGDLRAVWGTEAASAGSVVLPVAPKESMPIAVVTVQDDGTGLPGTIKNIEAQDVVDARPFFNNFLGQLRAEDINYCRVRSFYPATKQIKIFPGVVYPKAGFLVNFPFTALDFGSGVNAVPATPAGQYRKLLVTLNAAGNPLVFYGAPAATIGALVAPPTPKNVIPLAFVTVQDDGSATPGSILPIDEKKIQDIRPFLGRSGGGSGDGGTTSSQSYSDYLNTSTFEQGFYEDFSVDTYIDAVNTTGLTDVIVDNHVVLEPAQVYQTLNIFDASFGLTQVPRALVLVTATAPENLQIELTNDGGTTWNVIAANAVLTFPTFGTDLRVKFTNIGAANVTISDWAIFYNDDEISPSFLFSNERQPLDQIINFGDAEVVGNVVTLKDGRFYPVGENALMVFKNGQLLRKDPNLLLPNSYKELNTTQIQTSVPAVPGDYYQLKIPAGFFGQTVTQFTSSINLLLPAKHIVDQVVRLSEGSAIDIQTAINNLSTGGGRILLETQTWTVGTPIAVAAPIYLYSKTAQAVIAVLGSYNLNVFSVTTNAEFTLANVNISAVTYATNAVGVNLSGAASVATFDNCTFQNIGVGVNVAGNSSQLIFRNCKFINCGIPVAGKNNVVFENCIFDSCTTSGATVQNASIVRGCKFTNCAVAGLTVSGVQNVISGNQFSSGVIGLYLTAASGESAINGNKFLSNSGTGCQIDGNRNTFTGNICKSNQTGLAVNGSENIAEGNVITDNTADGIVVGVSAINNEIGTNVLLRNP